MRSEHVEDAEGRAGRGHRGSKLSFVAGLVGEEVCPIGGEAHKSRFGIGGPLGAEPPK